MAEGNVAVLTQDAPALSELAAQHGLQRRSSKPKGTPFATLLLEDHQERSAAVAGLLSQLAGSEIRVLRLNDPRRPDLTLGRIFAQVTGSEDKTLSADEVRLVAHAVAERQEQEARILLIVEQAETLRLNMLRSLQEMAPYFIRDGQPVLQVMFVGHPRFRTLLQDNTLAPLRQTLGMAEPSVAPLVAPVRTRFRRVPRSRILIYILLPPTIAFAVIAAVYLSLAKLLPQDATIAVARQGIEVLPPHPPPGSDGVKRPRVPEAIQPPTLPAPASAPAIPDLRLPESPPQGFAGTLQVMRSLSPVRDSPASTSHTTPAPAAPGTRIVVHVPEGTKDADRTLSSLLAALQQRPGRVEVRHVGETPARPSIRYFYAEDEAPARQVAAANPELTWAVQNFSWFRPLPLRGLVEVWLPGPR